MLIFFFLPVTVNIHIQSTVLQSSYSLPMYTVHKWTQTELIHDKIHLNPGPTEPRYVLPLQTVDTDHLASEEANWSWSVLFVIQYANLYQQSGLSNLIGWQLEAGLAS